jgi:hypothetical protein
MIPAIITEQECVITIAQKREDTKAGHAMGSLLIDTLGML